ncbi:hypothetical protein AB0A95_09010 [Micromonospora sp. NPDC049230]|uniref:hypothetical protein n=1 Tax=Micromonospora sp. NPDC049230 TaxID=3155502 RepID=UPI0033C7FFC0
MTTEADIPLPPEERPRRHRLVPRSTLEAKYQRRYANPAVATYALAVRDVVENCPDIGPIDTWQKLADRIYKPRSERDRAGSRKKLARLRKRLSRHFTAESKGPPWQTVVLVVEHVLPAALRQATLNHFAELYTLARDEEPPTGTRGDRAERSTEARTGSDLERRLQQRIEELEQTVVAHRVEISQLRADLASQSMSGGPAPDALPRQRDPLNGPPPNTRHFPPSQARAGGSAHDRYRAPRLDTGTVGLPGQSREQPPQLAPEPWHTRGHNLRNRP